MGWAALEVDSVSWYGRIPRGSVLIYCVVLFFTSISVPKCVLNSPWSLGCEEDALNAPNTPAHGVLGVAESHRTHG